MRLKPVLAEAIAEKLRLDGFDDCTAHDVREVERLGHLEGERDAALASRILQEMEAIGVEAGP